MSTSVGIRAALSFARVETFRRSTNGSDAACLARYVWNVALCEGLYPTLRFLEVALRTRIHHVATQHFGSEYWFADPKIVSPLKTDGNPRNSRAIRLAAGHRTPAHRIVSDLSLGFWVHLFGGAYEVSFWRPVIRGVFPGAPVVERSRAKVGRRLRRVLWLRNRVFHHEAIWSLRDLPERHREMLTIIAWISVPALQMAQVSDRFQLAYGMDLGVLEPRLGEIKM